MPTLSYKQEMQSDKNILNNVEKMGEPINI